MRCLTKRKASTSQGIQSLATANLPSRQKPSLINSAKVRARDEKRCDQRAITTNNKNKQKKTGPAKTPSPNTAKDLAVQLLEKLKNSDSFFISYTMESAIPIAFIFPPNLSTTCGANTVDRDAVGDSAKLN